MDPKSRQYISQIDGRFKLFHGLALKDSSPPWNLATYTQDQIQLLKSVSDLYIVSYLELKTKVDNMTVHLFSHAVGTKCGT